MATVATVTFEVVQGPHYFRLAEANGSDEPLAAHARMVGMTRFGLAVGKLVLPPYEATRENVPTDGTHVATAADLAREAHNRELAGDCQALGVALVRHHDLPMRVVGCFLSLDREQLTFFFTAPGRVDFRALVRDLAREFQLPIRLEQVGERDVARMLGGIGRCGRAVCCVEWMPAFEPVSMRHAKAQDLPPVPAQLGGLCGKLRCCLRFELDRDESDGARRCPRSNAPVKTAAYRWHEDDDAPLGEG